MGRMSLAELRRRGVSEEDIKAGLDHQESQRRAGAPVLPLAVIVGVVQPQPMYRVARPDTFTERALRRRGRYDQAALLLDQQALQEASPERATRARELSQGAKELSTAGQIEFDFLGKGNVTVGLQFRDAIRERLKAAAPTPAKRHEALAVLWEIVGNLGWQSHECKKTAAELCELTGMTPPHMARTLQLLESVGAIRRMKRGRMNVITVTPEGAFRGNVNHHAEAVESYRLTVIDGGKAGAPSVE